MLDDGLLQDLNRDSSPFVLSQVNVTQSPFPSKYCVAIQQGLFVVFFARMLGKISLLVWPKDRYHHVLLDTLSNT